MTSKDNKDEIPRPNIFLYYANIMDYFRVVSAMGAFYIAKSNPFAFEVLYFISFILDAFDGMVARAAGQKSKLGATLDMVTDRISTAGLLCVLSQFYTKYSVCFVFLMMLDVGSHWLQTHSSFLVNVHNDNHKNLEEKFWLLNFYYKNRYGLGITCLGAEIFLLLLYIGHFYSWLYENQYFMIFFYVNMGIYALKQVISIIQIVGASQRIATFDENEEMEAMRNKKH